MTNEDNSTVFRQHFIKVKTLKKLCVTLDKFKVLHSVINKRPARVVLYYNLLNYYRLWT